MTTDITQTSAQWITGTPKKLIAALRIGGWAQGHSALWPRYLRLSKTDLIADLRGMPADTACIYKILGDPEEKRRYAKNRRRVVIWLGSKGYKLS